MSNVESPAEAVVAATGAGEQGSTPTKTAPHEVAPLRRCLGQFATGVTVITVAHEGAYEGMAANSFSSVSLEPPLILWSVRKASRRASTFAGAPHFVVNILAEHQLELANRFAMSGENVFDVVAWREDSHGVPVLNGVVAHLSCDLETTYDGGDHIIIVGRVREYDVHEGKPLLFAQGRYAALQDYARYDTGDSGVSERCVDANVGAYRVMRLLRSAQESLSRSFEVHRHSVGLTALEARILAILHASPATMQQLANQIFADEVNTRESVGRLRTAGLVQYQSDGAYTLTAAGNAKRELLRERAQQFSAQMLNDMGPEKLRIAREFLTEIVERFSKFNE